MPENATQIKADFMMVDLIEIMPSETNPRTHFDKEALDELAQSVRDHGILQPILVRPVKKIRPANSAKYEIVAGERRYRAAQAAGLDAMPAVIRELSDLQALEVQVIENLQRADLNPLDEADGYQRLIEQHGYSAEDLAIRLGKSRSYVYGRIKLASLPSTAKKAVWEGVLMPSTALLIARIPDAQLREQAAARILKPHNWRHDNEPMTHREAADFIHRDYMLRLKDAPFPTDDAELVPAAGTCNACPKRTGNQRELFGDVQSADVCTDPKCFQKKGDAQWQRRAKELQAAGHTVLEGKDAKKLVDKLGHLRASGYVELNDTCRDDPQYRHWRKLLGKKTPARTVVRDEREDTPLAPLDWVIVGGESGPGRGPCIRTGRVRSGISVRRPELHIFSSSGGEWLPENQINFDDAANDQLIADCLNGKFKQRVWWTGIGSLTAQSDVSHRVGKKTAGRLLDGREWSEFPAEPMRCRHCGCTDDRACEGGCYWVQPGVCSECAHLVEAGGIR